MHFEFLVEDQSGKKMLEILVPKLLEASAHTWNIISYKGVGHIPTNLRGKTDPKRRILLDRLPKLLQGYGNAFSGYPADYPAAVVLVCDLDDKCLKAFRQELDHILESCSPQPLTRFCLAVEEGEAWFLGDLKAIRKAYPNAREPILISYQTDSICGTWELLANALFPGGVEALSAKGHHAVGKEKSLWAERITPHMDVRENSSPSFLHFKEKVEELAQR